MIYENTPQEKLPHAIVADMNEAFGNARGAAVGNAEKLRSQTKNIGDEINELKAATHDLEIALDVGASDETLKKIREKIRDAFCDVQVFGFGSCHLFNVDLGEDAYFFGVGGPRQLPFTKEGILAEIKAETLRLESAFEKTMENCNDYVEAVESGNDAAIVYATQMFNHLQAVIVCSIHGLHAVGANVVNDMNSVIDGVMTRFCKDEADLQATIDKWTGKGLDVYVEGEFPRKIVKSSKDQPDAPKGKFLKSVSYKEANFESLPLLR